MIRTLHVLVALIAVLVGVLCVVMLAALVLLL